MLCGSLRVARLRPIVTPALQGLETTPDLKVGPTRGLKVGPTKGLKAKPTRGRE